MMIEQRGAMMVDERKKGLGRGLSALIGEAATDTAFERNRAPRDLPIDMIIPNPDQPRRHFDPDRLAELAASIREKGIIQPIVVRPRTSAKGEGTYEILAGERRWRAAQLAGLHVVPVVLREVDHAEA